MLTIACAYLLTGCVGDSHDTEAGEHTVSAGRVGQATTEAPHSVPGMYTEPQHGC